MFLTQEIHRNKISYLGLVYTTEIQDGRQLRCVNLKTIIINITAVAHKNVMLVSIPMFLYPRNPLKTKSATHDQYLPTKSKMAAKVDA